MIVVTIVCCYCYDCCCYRVMIDCCQHYLPLLLLLSLTMVVRHCNDLLQLSEQPSWGKVPARCIHPQPLPNVMTMHAVLPCTHTQWHMCRLNMPYTCSCCLTCKRMDSCCPDYSITMLLCQRTESISCAMALLKAKSQCSGSKASWIQLTCT